jgi:hypothetical protein
MQIKEDFIGCALNGYRFFEPANFDKIFEMAKYRF